MGGTHSTPCGYAPAPVPMPVPVHVHMHVHVLVHVHVRVCVRVPVTWHVHVRVHVRVCVMRMRMSMCPHVHLHTCSAISSALKTSYFSRASRFNVLFQLVGLGVVLRPPMWHDTDKQECEGMSRQCDIALVACSVLVSD